jgi:hypothetical protein
LIHLSASCMVHRFEHLFSPTEVQNLTGEYQVRYEQQISTPFPLASSLGIQLEGGTDPIFVPNLNWVARASGTAKPISDSRNRLW